MVAAPSDLSTSGAPLCMCWGRVSQIRSGASGALFATQSARLETFSFQRCTPHKWRPRKLCHLPPQLAGYSYVPDNRHQVPPPRHYWPPLHPTPTAQVPPPPLPLPPSQLPPSLRFTPGPWVQELLNCFEPDLGLFEGARVRVTELV